MLFADLNLLIHLYYKYVIKLAIIIKLLIRLLICFFVCSLCYLFDPLRLTLSLDLFFIFMSTLFTCIFWPCVMDTTVQRERLLLVALLTWKVNEKVNVFIFPRRRRFHCLSLWVSVCLCRAWLCLSMLYIVHVLLMWQKNLFHRINWLLWHDNTLLT